MVSKELKKLSRRELIEIIYQMKKNEQQMQEKITALESALEEKRLRISQAGSIAEAAVSVANVLNAAQEAADLYLHEIACMKAEIEREKAITETSEADSDWLLAELAPPVPDPARHRSEQSKPQKAGRWMRHRKR